MERNLHVSDTLRLVVYYKSRKWEVKIRLMNESRDDERLNCRVQELDDSHTLGYTTKQTRNTYRQRWGQQTRNSWMQWASARSRHDGSPTDTQADTKSRSPRPCLFFYYLFYQQSERKENCLFCLSKGKIKKMRLKRLVFFPFFFNIALIRDCGDFFLPGWIENSNMHWKGI